MQPKVQILTASKPSENSAYRTDPVANQELLERMFRYIEGKNIIKEVKEHPGGAQGLLGGDGTITSLVHAILFSAFLTIFNFKQSIKQAVCIS